MKEVEDSIGSSGDYSKSMPEKRTCGVAGWPKAGQSKIRGRWNGTEGYYVTD
jgi:hypothetical protein